MRQLAGSCIENTIRTKPASVGTDVVDDGLLHELEGRLDRPGRGHDHPAAVGQHAVHLADGGGRSSTNIRLIWQSTTSKLASANGSDVASPWRHSIGARPGRGQRAATAIMSAATSTPVTEPVGSDGGRGLSGDDPGAAADVEHPLARLEGGGAEQPDRDTGAPMAGTK